MANMNAKIEAENSNKMEAAQKVLDDAKSATKEDVTPSLDDVIEDMNVKVKTKDGIKTIKELYDGHLMQSDYTKKTMALKDVEKQLKSELGEYQDYASAVQTYFNDKPEAYQRFVDYFQNPDGTAPQTTEGKSGTVRNAEYDRQLNENNKAIQGIQKQLEEDARLKRVDDAISKLQSNYKLNNSELEMIIKVANGDYNEKISEYDNLDNAFNSIKKLLEDERIETTKKETVKSQDKAGAQFLGGGSKSQSNVKSVQQTVKEALANVTDGANDIL